MKYITLYRLLDFYLGIILCFILTVFKYIPWPRFGGRKDGPERVLFIELSEMGSTVLAYPAIREFQARHENAEVYFLTFKRNQAGVEILGQFEASRILTMRDDTLVGLFADFLKLMCDYRRIRFTTCIDLELFSRFSVMLTFLSGARQRIGFHNYTGEGLYRGDLLTHRVLYNPHIHIAYNFLALAQAAVEPVDELPLVKKAMGDIPLDAPDMSFDEAKLRHYREMFSSRRPLVVFNPDSGPALPIRNWGLDRYIAVIDGLTEQYDATCVLVGTDTAAASGDRILRSVKQPEKVENMIGRTETIVDLIHLIAAADAFLTNDSGPGHFAALTETPTFVFFGPETPRLYGPIGRNCTSLYSDFACSPCLTAANHRRSSCVRSRCLEAISSDTVIQDIARRLPVQG